MAHLEELLKFPEEAVHAAKQFAKIKWKLDETYDGDLITAIECEICNNFQNGSINYGVADAILLGKRVRLLNEMQGDKIRMNCAEVGINTFLIYSTFSPKTKMALMRYNDGQAADHFAVLNYDLGVDEMPTILDPLFGFSGRAKFTSGGFMHIPINLLHIQSKGLPKNEEKAQIRALDEEDSPKHVSTKPIFMSIDNVIRHVNYLNSPLGFFDYFKRGQKLFSVDSGFSEIEFNAKTIGQSLRVSASQDSLFPGMITLERTYKMNQDGDVIFSDKNIFHMGYRWMEPNNLISAETSKSLRMFHPQGNRKYSNFFFLYVRELAAKNLEYLSESSARYDYIMKKEKLLQDYNQKIIKTKVNDLSRLNLFEEAELENARLNVEKFLGFLNSLDKADRGRLVDYIIFCDNPRNSRRRSFRGVDNAGTIIKKYVDMRFRQIQPKIIEFFGSDVLSCLLDQYKDAICIKRKMQEISDEPNANRQYS